MWWLVPGLVIFGATCLNDVIQEKKDEKVKETLREIKSKFSGDEEIRKECNDLIEMVDDNKRTSGDFKIRFERLVYKYKNS